MERVCRTCLAIIRSPAKVISLDATGHDLDPVTVRQKLTVLLPQLTLDIVHDPVICFPCFAGVYLSYQFTSACLETEKNLYQHIRQRKRNLYDLLTTAELLNIVTRTLNEEHNYSFVERSHSNDDFVDWVGNTESSLLKFASVVQPSLVAFVEQALSDRDSHDKKDKIEMAKIDNKVTGKNGDQIKSVTVIDDYSSLFKTKSNGAGVIKSPNSSLELPPKKSKNNKRVSKNSKTSSSRTVKNSKTLSESNKNVSDGENTELSKIGQGHCLKDDVSLSEIISVQCPALQQSIEVIYDQYEDRKPVTPKKISQNGAEDNCCEMPSESSKNVRYIKLATSKESLSDDSKNNYCEMPLEPKERVKQRKQETFKEVLSDDSDNNYCEMSFKPKERAKQRKLAVSEDSLSDYSDHNYCEMPFESEERFKQRKLSTFKESLSDKSNNNYCEERVKQKNPITTKDNVSDNKKNNCKALPKTQRSDIKTNEGIPKENFISDKTKSSYYQIYSKTQEGTAKRKQGIPKKNCSNNYHEVFAKTQESAKQTTRETSKTTTCNSAENKYKIVPKNPRISVTPTVTATDSDLKENDVGQYSTEPKKKISNKDDSANNEQLSNKNKKYCEFNNVEYNQNVDCSPKGFTKNAVNVFVINSIENDIAEINESISKATNQLRHRYQCPKCNKGYSFKSHYDVHLKTHIFKKLYSCPICQKDFAQEKYLKTHALLHTTSGPYQCDICLKFLSSSTALKRHYVTHTGEKPHACSCCGKGFAQKIQLHIHMRTHTGFKPFECYICHASFSQKSHLLGHTRIHTGEKPFKCNICPKRFCKSSALQIHMRSHNNKPFQCKACNFLFKNPDTFERHVNKHLMRFSTTGSYVLKKSAKPIILNEPGQDVKDINMALTLRKQISNNDRCIPASKFLEHYSKMKLYHCSVCSKGFTSNYNMLRHMKVHAEDAEK